MTTIALARPALPIPTPPPATLRRTPIQRCLTLLDRLARDGIAFAHRLRTIDTSSNRQARERANHLFHRALLALRHLAILTAKLTADLSYRGEPARPARPHTLPTEPRLPRSDAPTGRHPTPRPFEQLFAGRSVGQIIDHIRQDLGLPGRIAPLIDRQLATPPRRDPPPLPPLPAILRRIAPALIPPPALAAVTPAAGPPD